MSREIIKEAAVQFALQQLLEPESNQKVSTMVGIVEAIKKNDPGLYEEQIEPAVSSFILRTLKNGKEPQEIGSAGQLVRMVLSD